MNRQEIEKSTDSPEARKRITAMVKVAKRQKHLIKNRWMVKMDFWGNPRYC